VTSILASKPATNAGIRTTTAVTMMRAGVKDNVIPASASATVNFRLLAGDSVAAVIEHVKTAIADTRVVVTPREDAHEASAVSSIDGPGFGFVARAIREVDDGTLVMPINSLGATDGRKYQSAVAKDVYRFLPARLTGDDLTRIHGKDERAALADVDRAVRFYRRFIVLAASQR
jgi:carboxypeptidase PM20D1